MAFAQASQPLITQPINESNLVVLSGNTRPEAKNLANDRGLVADTMPLPHMLLQLRRPAAQEQALGALLDQLHDPHSPNFHHWLSPAELGVRFGPAAADIQMISSWLQQQGFSVNRVYPNGLVIDFSGTAGQVRAAFHTEIHNLSINGVAHFANMTDPQIPAALGPAVVGIVSLNDFPPHPAFTTTGSNYNCYGYNVITTSCYQLAPADLATIYNFNPVFNEGITGQGQTIYLVENGDLYAASDWTTFRSLFGLSGYTSASLTTIHPAPPSGNNNCSDPGTTGDRGETTLDTEWASAAAPSAAIVVASCSASGGTGGWAIAAENLLNGASPPAIISMSFLDCEPDLGAAAQQALSSAFQTGVAAGTSIFVSAGDQGGAQCDYQVTNGAKHGIAVNGFASTPYNVAVGGTDFADTYLGQNSTYWNSTNSATWGSAKSYIPEIPWNDSCASQLVATYEASSTPSFCNSSPGSKILEDWAGGGGPSGCATGTPSITDVVSGTCQGYAKPSWQSGLVGNPNDGVRDLPDVSLFASGGPWGHSLTYCYTAGGTSCTYNGFPDEYAYGTSASSPMMAGVQALIDQKYGGPQGLPNYRLYQLAGREYGQSGSSACNSSNGNAVGGSCIFYDVTMGDTSVPCATASGGAVRDCYLGGETYGVLSTSNNSNSPAFAAGVGWDFSTGIGSLNVAGLLANWVTAAQSAVDTHDFNGDGTSDILWRNTSSNEVAMWLMSNGQLSSGANVAQVPSAWSISGTRDFSGDGDADLLWVDTSGDVAIWLMNGAAVSSGIGLGNVGTQWSVAGTGDFNSDGVGDILWRNSSTGDLAVWLMSNGAFSSGIDLGALPSTWQVVGTGDFNGNGTSDILWRNTSTGDLTIWFLHGGQFSSGADLGVVPLSWTVVGTGDFNGDGTSDILWRDSSGNLAIWLISNGQLLSGAALGQVPTTWSVAETGDFNGDGKSDILWLDQSGDLAVWLMNGLSVSAYDSLGNVGASWQVKGQNSD